MSQNTQWDSLDYQVLNFPYNRINTEFDPEPRISSGQNSYITYGGKLAKRPGTITLDTDNTLEGRIDRLWSYETLETPPNVYIVASVFNGLLWELRYKLMAASVTGWQTPTSLRDCNASTRPHELAVSRGLAYVKCFPDPLSAEKLGTVVLDGSDGVMATKPWGLLGPQTPATVFGALTFITADMTSSQTTMAVDDDANFPTVPFTVQVGYEQITVTAGLPGLTWTITRGVNGTTAVEHVEGEAVIFLDWSVSDHLVEVNYGWKYSYAYKSITGQVSNRAPIETNPDQLPSFTGPFFDLIPKITVQGIADTTNYPTIVIYRTTDGGGTFYKLEEIPNTGAGDIIYLDDSLESGSGGGTFNDPIPDAVLDQFDLSPSLTSNSPPPAALEPAITGEDPVEPSTPIVSYQSRLWYGIGNVLFFSAEEELNEGIPEESFPSGAQNGRNGNFYRFQYPIINLSETSEALYVFTIQATYRITGNNLETFSPSPAFENYGAPPGHPRAVNRYGDTVVFLTHDYRIALIDKDQLKLISDPLWTDLVDALDIQGEFDIKYFGDLDKEWVVVTSERKDAPSASRQWVYDIKKSAAENKPFWFTPWDIQSVASLSARVVNNSSQRRLVFAIYDPVEEESALVRIDPTGQTGTDYFFGTRLGFTYVTELHQMLVPAGNHVNALRVPGATPTVYGVTVDRVRFPNDFDPDFYWYYDDLWSDPDQAKRTENPPRRTLSKGYQTMLFTIHRACQHFSIRIAAIDSSALLEIMRIAILWDPDSGS